MNLKDITDADYAYAKTVQRDIEKKLREYHDFYVQNDTLLLSDAFENFRNRCLKIDNLHSAKPFERLGSHDKQF